MKIAAAALMLTIAATATSGQTPGNPSQADGREYVRKPNYALAERFSAKRVGQMVFTTEVRPSWFRTGNRFLYQWKTSSGTNYYIADPVLGKTTPVFDLDKLAMKLTEIVRDPFDARHIPFRNLEIDPDDENYLTFNITSTQERRDTTDKEKKNEKLVYRFRYRISDGNLTYTTDKEEDKYPRWANVSPDGLIGVYVKNANLYYMDTLNMRKAAKDPKDSTLVEHRITTDGFKEFAYGIDNYKGYNETDTTARTYPGELVWGPDSKHLAVMRWDMRPLKEMWVINSLSNPRPILETYKYQMPGEPGPKGSLYVFETAGWSSHTVRINAFKDQELSLDRAPRKVEDSFKDYYSSKWHGDNNGFYLTRMSRDLKRMDICYVGVDSDSTRTVISERMNTYVEGRGLEIIGGGRQLIHWSERNGWANLYLYNADGTLVRNLTEGAFHVEDIVSVNEKEGYVLFS
ncbi:MAG: DPP IV N-terminal domain-containing protein, partial [Candidatus Cryptobacteroides sp.]